MHLLFYLRLRLNKFAKMLCAFRNNWSLGWVVVQKMLIFAIFEVSFEFLKHNIPVIES